MWNRRHLTAIIAVPSLVLLLVGVSRSSESEEVSKQIVNALAMHRQIDEVLTAIPKSAWNAAKRNPIYSALWKMMTIGRQPSKHWSL